MERQHVDITQDLEGEPVVHAIFDLREEEIGASAHAVTASCAERFRNTEMSADDVVEFRELTALADELRELAGGAGTIVMRPARLNAYRARARHVRRVARRVRVDPRRGPRAAAIARSLLWPLEELSAETMQAALSPAASRHA